MNPSTSLRDGARRQEVELHRVRRGWDRSGDQAGIGGPRLLGGHGQHRLGCVLGFAEGTVGASTASEHELSISANWQARGNGAT
ncbi:hypothetical protein [Streptomyces sp. NPDC045714]|uniref:hypothetical protein n=1 Tax=Streptomyces sp. NPDC045714 TaxID=3154913 RepID=UPI0033F4408C